MSLCILADGLGVGADLQHAALQTWVRPSHEVSAAWLVRDSQIQGHAADECLWSSLRAQMLVYMPFISFDLQAAHFNILHGQVHIPDLR